MLNEHHSKSLTLESAIALELVEARGYKTVTQKTELKELGFADFQQLVPALVIPIHNVLGELAGYQSRPESPRVSEGRPVKYETPRGQRMVLDIPPSIRHLLCEPTVPLFVTEGIKKGDALATHGLATVALLGVWNWRGRNALGGTTVLPDWESIALNGRQVYIAFDSDVMVKQSANGALERLKPLLESRGAEVALIYLPPLNGGPKQGVDDFFASGGTVESLLALASNELLSVPETQVAEQGRSGDSMATQMVAIALEADLFHDEKSTAFAAVDIKGHRETWPVRSLAFRRWLAGAFYSRTGKAPKSASISDVLTIVEARAQFDADQRQVWNRRSRRWQHLP